MFRNPVDIANRALQYCGALLIDPTVGFTEDSVNAAECSFAYDKLRKAELRRNTWRFATKFAVLRAIQSDPTKLPSMLLVPPLYASTITYSYGALVTDTAGNIWESQSPDNLANGPGNSGAWELYYGPMAIPPWDTTAGTSYFSGDVVYTTPGDGTYRVFRSVQPSNTDTPATVSAWDATLYYKKDSVVVSSSVNYQSLIDFNLNQLPSATTAPALWDATVTYATGNRVRASDGLMYLSVGNGNLANDPHFDNGTNWTATGVLAAWTTVLTQTASSVKWLDLGATLSELLILAPTGARSGQQSRNLYRLPANYLRILNQDPKAGSVSFLGAPSGQTYLDWEMDGDFITTRETNPIIFRFVGDVTNVLEFDDMFCEGLAARLGHAVAPKITQSAAKAQEIAQAYQKFMSEARTVGSIETGAVEPEEDDWVSTRL